MSTAINTRPYADSRIAKFLDKRIDELSGVKSQRDIAREAGFSTPNIISMMKKGDAKVPLDRVVAMARALDVDAKYFMRMALEQFMGNDISTANLLDMVISDNEKEILQAIREVNPGDPALNDHRREAIKAAFAV